MTSIATMNCGNKFVMTNLESSSSCSFGDRVQSGAIISANASEGRKRTRTEGNVATTTHPWDKTKFLERIPKIALDLGSIRGYVT